jgi:hypothetical protein
MFPYIVTSVWWHNEYVLIRQQYVYMYMYMCVCVCV